MEIRLNPVRDLLAPWRKFLILSSSSLPRILLFVWPIAKVSNLTDAGSFVTKCLSQCEDAYNKTQWVHFKIRIYFVELTAREFVRLYRSLVRSHLQYIFHACTPYQDEICSALPVFSSQKYFCLAQEKLISSFIKHILFLAKMKILKYF